MPEAPESLVGTNALGKVLEDLRDVMLLYQEASTPSDPDLIDEYERLRTQLYQALEDARQATATSHLVELNTDGSVKSKAATLEYKMVKEHLSDPARRDYLDVRWENGPGTGQFTQFHAECVGISEANAGALMFVATVLFVGNGSVMTMLFSLDSNDHLTTVASLSTQEQYMNKVQSVVDHATSPNAYPSTYAVFNEFQRKPVTVWEHTGTKIKAANADIAENLSWQITGLDLTPYKRVKFYVTPGVSSNNVAPAGVVEVPLDPLAANSNTYGHYAASAVFQYLNNANRLYTCSFCVSSDKTKVIFLRQTSLYGTAGTSAVDDSRYLYKIEGYFD